MKFNCFEEILSWKKAKELTILIYQDFKYCRDFGFKDQVQRASVSIMNNIAEGFERKGNKEFVKFLYIAKGSCAEVRSMLYLADNLKYIDNQKYQKLSIKSLEISRLLSGLIKTLQTLRTF